MTSRHACSLTVAQFKDWRDQGLSYEAMGARLGVSRNAVSGFAFRHGLSRPKTPGDGPRGRKRTLPTSAKERGPAPWSMKDAPTLAAPEAAPRRGREAEIRRGPVRKCQWIEGKPSHDDSCKCLAETLPGKPYCAQHFQRSVTAHVYKGKAGDVPLWMAA